MNEVLIEINIAKYQQCENLKLKNSSNDQQQWGKKKFSTVETG